MDVLLTLTAHSQLQQGCSGAVWQASDHAQQYGDAVSERAGVLCS